MKISICIPVYNVSEYVERCAKSLFEQSYSDIEYIFVDDCTPDDSITKVEKVLDSYPARKSSVNIIRHEKNRGLAAARNTAIEDAHGEFIMHVDSDDWLEPDAVESLVKKQEETGADIVSANAMAHYSDHDELMKEPEYADKDEMMRHMSELTLDHVIWRRLIWRSLYTDNNIRCMEGVNIGEDHHTLPRLIYYAKKCVAVDKVIYHYNCTNKDSYMRARSDEALLKRFRSDLASIDILLDFFKDKDAQSVKELKDIRADFLYNFAMQHYFKENNVHYDEAMCNLYAMGNDNLVHVGIIGSWQKFIHKTYFRFRTYNNIRTRIKG